MLSVAKRPAPTELDDATLRRAMRGDDPACRELVELYQSRVFALVSRMLSGRGRATIEDIAQDTFLVVFRRLGDFSPLRVAFGDAARSSKAGPCDARGTAKLSVWILTIAARRAIDELRKQRPVLLAEVPERGASDDRMHRRDVALAIEAALRELSPELRAAFLLREYHGLEYAEIAKALSIDLGTVKSRLSRARAGLRERLAEVKP